MVSRWIWRWWRRAGERATAHSESWAPALERDSSGLALFQKTMEQSVRLVVERAGLRLEVEVVEVPASDSDFGPYIHATVPGRSVELWLHDDTFCMEGPRTQARFEHWDFDTPDELLAEFIGRLSANLGVSEHS